MKVKKNNLAYKTISEVSMETDIPAYILRFWEKKFARLQKVRRQNSHRYYNAEDIAFLLEIKRLINTEGYTVKGVQNYLNNKNNNRKNINEKKVIAILSEIKEEIEFLINNN